MEPYDALEENKDNGFVIYPNPANDYITIVGEVPETTQIFLMNIHGQLMDVDVKHNQIDVSNLPNGIYFMKIREKSTMIGEKSTKIIIEK